MASDKISQAVQEAGMVNAGATIGMYYPNLIGTFVRWFPSVTARVAGKDARETVTFQNERFEIIGDPHNEGTYAFDVLAVGPAPRKVI